jgi:site-specific DNA-methyltransferase (adenine-specific)
MSTVAEILGNTFYCEDCIRGAARHLVTGSVDLIITDPPYGIGGDSLHRHYNRNERYVIPGYVEVPAEDYSRFSRMWVNEAARVLRPGGSMYVFSGYTNLYHIMDALRRSGLCEVNHLIWKFNFGVHTRRKFISSHYHILYYEKPGGRRRFNLESRFLCEERDSRGRSENYRDREDVWVINREYKPGLSKNKNELPIPLLAKMIQYSSCEGDLIADFFLGGFSTARAAIGLNRRVTGFEISPEIFSRKLEDIRGCVPGFLMRPCDRRVGEDTGRSYQRWTIEEQKRLVSRFRVLSGHGRTRKDVIAILGNEFGRGRFGIARALRRAGI